MAAQADVGSPSDEILQEPIELQQSKIDPDDRVFASSKDDDQGPTKLSPPPSASTSVIERWNRPKINIWRTIAAFFTFIMMGANDAAYGALIPYIEEWYNLTYVVVSLIFLSPVVGYSSAALLNNTIHVRFGQRGVAAIGPTLHLLAYIGIALHPPYPVLIVVFVLAGFSNGLLEAAWNAWIGGNMANSSEVLGFLHGIYGLGAVISPLVATSMVEKADWPWYVFYYVMIGGALLEFAICLPSFWSISGRVYRESSNYNAGGTKDNHLRDSLRSRVTWIISVYLLVYTGIEVALGGWIVTFMRRERAGKAFESGTVAMGFWIGIALGRFVLGFLTPRLGEKTSALGYIFLTILCQLLFWLVPQFEVSATAVSLQGFFLGPLFPAAVVIATKLLPMHLHVPAIGFAVAFSGGGAAILPFGIGALAQAKGVSVLPPVILTMLVTILILWICLPRLDKATRRKSSQETDTKGWWRSIDFDLIRSIQKLRNGG